MQRGAGKVCTQQTLWDATHHHSWVLNLISEFSLPSMKVLVALLGWCGSGIRPCRTQISRFERHCPSAVKTLSNLSVCIVSAKPHSLFQVCSTSGGIHYFAKLQSI